MKVIFWGIGRDFQEAVHQYPDLLECADAFADNGTEIESIKGKPVIRPEHIPDYEPDKVIISSSKYFKEIYRQCHEKIGIDEEKIKSLQEFINGEIISGGIIPSYIKVEACSLCQLNCKSCYMRLNKNHTIGNGYLRFDNFKKLVDDNPVIKGIELSNWGEVFLNPELKKILEYAHSRDIDITLGGGVNFNTVGSDMLETLVKTQVKFVNVSIDGTSQEVYSQYRVGGNYADVIRNIRRLNYYKTLYGSEFPILQWQFIIMEQNEHQVLEAKKLSESLGMKIFFKLQHDEGYVPKDSEFLHEVTGLDCFSIEEYLKNTGEAYISSCREVFESPQINWDGRLLGCCRVIEHDFGVNVFEVGLKKALSSSEYVNTKKMLLGDSSVEVDQDTNPCVGCYIYKIMKESNNWYIKENLKL